MTLFCRWREKSWNFKTWLVQYFRWRSWMAGQTMDPKKTNIWYLHQAGDSRIMRQVDDTEINRSGWVTISDGSQRRHHRLLQGCRFIKYKRREPLFVHEKIYWVWGTYAIFRQRCPLGHSSFTLEVWVYLNWFRSH